MIKFTPVKKITVAVLILLLPVFLITFQGCRKKRSEVANLLFKKTHNKVFQEYTPEGFSKVFKKVLNRERSNLKHADFIIDHYTKNHYKPELLIDHLFNNDMYTMTDYYLKANEHGLDASMFDADGLRTLIYKFNDKTHSRTIDEAYNDIAELELTAANSLINYSNALQYGIINPKIIYQR